MTVYRATRGWRIRPIVHPSPLTGVLLVSAGIMIGLLAFVPLSSALRPEQWANALGWLPAAGLAAVICGYLIAQREQPSSGRPEQADAALESQKRFVANASHELRTPLTVIRTEIDVTTGDPDADLAEYRRMAGVVRNASIRANALVESLLVLARTEAQAGRRLVRKVAVDLSAGVRTALSGVAREAERSRLDITTDLAPAPVVGDPGLLDRLAGNLIENAVRYNHLGGEVTVRSGSDDRWAWLVVRNTGFEVDPADVPALFEPFRRGGRERTGNRGSGLGLSIVRAVCDAHGGSVTAIALDGGGLEVSIRLPAAATTPLHTGSATVTG